MDAKGIINLGLSKLGAYSVNNIAPAVTPLEKRNATNYPQWRDSELAKGRWIFARGYFVLTEGGGGYETAERPYSFELPAEVLRVIREKGAKWAQRGRYLYSSSATLTIEAIFRPDETQFDPLFIDVLSTRIALEECEPVTQSNTKKADLASEYKERRRMAVAANALVLGNDDQIGEEDDDDDWMTARRGYGL